MEVDGKMTNTMTDVCKLMCKPCEDDNKRVATNGICRECDEHMCIACFDNHKKYKVCKDHTLVDLDTCVRTLSENIERKGSESEENKDEDYEICELHCKENIKFYCPGHDEVGCGDCMILQHKACKVEYLRNKAAAFVDSADFRQIVIQIDECRKGTRQCAISLTNNKIQIEDINQGFLAEVKNFRDDINDYLDKLEERLLQETNKTKENDQQHIETLQKACAELETELSELSCSIESKTSDPSKQFVAAVHCKQKLKSLNQRLGAIMASNKISEYRFRRNSTMEQLLEQAELGTVENKLIDERAKAVVDYERPLRLYENKAVNHDEPVYMELNPTDMESKPSEYAQLEHGHYIDMTPGKINVMKSVETTERKPDKNETVIGLSVELKSRAGIEDTLGTYEQVKPGTHRETISGEHEKEPRKPNEINTAKQEDLNAREYEEVKLKPEPPVPLQIKRPSQKKDTIWSLFGNQLRCENLLMAGDVLSYKENARSEPGLYICKKAIKTGTYLEIEIVSTDSNGNISIGFVPKDYPLRQSPGHGRFSVGYHCGDGCIYDQGASGKRIGPPCSSGDVIGIGVSSYLTNIFKTKLDIFVTRNRKKICEIGISGPSVYRMYPAVSLLSPAEKVKVHMYVKER